MKSHIEKSSNLDANALYESRVKGKHILLENPPRASRLKQKNDGRKSRRAAERERKKRAIIGRDEVKKKGLWKLEKSQCR